MELVLRELRPSGAAGPKAARVQRLEMLHPLGQVSVGFFAAGLVAVGHQEKRRVVAVGPEDAGGLVIDPLVHRLAVAQGCGLVGPAGLDLVIEAQLVGGNKGGLGRAIRVEADQVQAVGLGDADDALPRINIRRRMAGEREDAAFERAADEHLVAVEQELIALGRDFAQAEGGRATVPCARQSGGQTIERWIELIPQLGLVPEGKFGFKGAALFIPANLVFWPAFFPARHRGGLRRGLSTLGRTCRLHCQSCL